MLSICPNTIYPGPSPRDSQDGFHTLLEAIDDQISQPRPVEHLHDVPDMVNESTSTSY